MTFLKHITFSIRQDGLIERGSTDLPAAVRLPLISVTLAPNATPQLTARLLRRLADELEGATL